jgi:hypothetical protein
MRIGHCGWTELEGFLCALPEGGYFNLDPQKGAQIEVSIGAQDRGHGSVTTLLTISAPEGTLAELHLSTAEAGQIGITLFAMAIANKLDRSLDEIFREIKQVFGAAERRTEEGEVPMLPAEFFAGLGREESEP